MRVLYIAAVIFGGLRVRMGVHTAPVENLQLHAVTNRVIYPHDLIHTTSLVQGTPCGGQVGHGSWSTRLRLIKQGGRSNL
jgi:hypothetical protein